MEVEGGERGGGGGEGEGDHSCLLFKQKEETCQEKIVWSRKLSWLESPSSLLASMNAALAAGHLYQGIQL